MTGYTSVLFYASLCPFSRSIYPAFEALSLMFPQIEHLAVEQSSSMPRFEATRLTSALFSNVTFMEY